MANDGPKIAGMSPEEIQKTVAHPAAAAEIERLMALEKSSVQPGDPAPDFALPRLTSSDAARVRLSDHFGKRPVALVFGSYT